MEEGGDLRMNFPEQLRFTRMIKGLTQEKLAEMAHMTQSEISHYENGRRIPGEYEIKILEDVLKTRFYRGIKMSESERLSDIHTMEELLKGAEELSDKMAVGYSAAQRRALYLTILLCAGFELYVCENEPEEEMGDVTWEVIESDLFFLLENCEGIGIYETVRQMTDNVRGKLNSESEDSFFVQVGRCAQVAGGSLLSILGTHEDAFATEFKVLLSTASDQI